MVIRIPFCVMNKILQKHLLRKKWVLIRL